MYLKIKNWEGRLGNNIDQIIKTIILALEIKANIIFKDHDYFNKNKIILFENIEKKTIKKIYEGNGKSKFYQKDKIKYYVELKKQDYEKLLNFHEKLIKKVLRNIFIINTKSTHIHFYRSKVLIIYIRSGDLFGKVVHPKYVSAPLYFYKCIIEKYKNIYKKFILVAEDNLNPVIKRLLENYPFIIWNKNNLKDDIKVILGASHIVSCIGTFISSLSWMSRNIKKVYLPSYVNPKSYNPECIIEKIELPNFIESMGAWENSKKNNKLLLKYKPEKE